MKSILARSIIPLITLFGMAVGFWIATDAIEYSGLTFTSGIFADAEISCGGCHRFSEGGSASGFGGSFGGFGGGGGELGTVGKGGPAPLPSAPVCTLDLTKEKITWTSKDAHVVIITPTTDSPKIPGGSQSSASPAGTILWGGNFSDFKATYASRVQKDATAHGGVTLGDASFKADKLTADRLCSAVFPGSVNGIFDTDTFSSPKNNTIAKWDGGRWSVVPAPGNDPHIRFSFTCVTPSNDSALDLSGSHTFVPPLGVGTHVYTLTAKGRGGTSICEASVTVPLPPPEPAPGCVEVLKETFDPSGVKLTPTAQFTFKLDGSRTAVSDANGRARFDNVAPGTHTVSEVNPGSAWKLISITPKDGNVIVKSGSTCAAVVFKNQQVLPPPPSASPTCKLTLPAAGTSISWESMNAKSVSITPTTNSPAVGTNLPLNGSQTFNPPLGPGDHFYKMSVVGTNGESVFCGESIHIAPPPPNAPTCTLDATAEKITWSSTNAASVAIAPTTASPSVGSNLAASGSKDFIPPLPIGEHFYKMTVVGTNGDSVFCGARVEVQAPPPPPPGPSCALFVDRSNIKPGESVKISWTSSNVTSGEINGNVGVVSPASGGTTPDIFPSDSTQYTGVFTGPQGTATCTVSVEVERGGGGGGGGGLNQPTVKLLQSPSEQPLAFVSLTQIPYTGFEAGPLLSALFWLAVVLWSAGIAYLIVGKESMRFVVARLWPASPIHYGAREESAPETLSYNDAPDNNNSSYAEYAAFPQEPHNNTALRTSSQALAPSVIAAPAFSHGAAEDLQEAIEARAHQSGILLSPEAIREALRLSPDNDETIRTFGEVLNEAAKTLPRENGWILLSSDRLLSIAGALGGKRAAPLEGDGKEMEKQEPLTGEAVERMLAAVLEGKREETFSLLRELEGAGASATRVTTEAVQMIDRLYRSREQNAPIENLTLREKAEHVSLEDMRYLLEVFSGVLDTTYSLPYTGLKIALAQSFDRRL